MRQTAGMRALHLGLAVLLATCRRRRFRPISTAAPSEFPGPCPSSASSCRSPFCRSSPACLGASPGQDRRLLGARWSSFRSRCPRPVDGAATRSSTRALLEYIPFILLLLALFTVAGGIVITRQPPRLAGGQHGAARASAPLLASFIGTTGASMVMIRPLLRANDDRRHNAHVVVFFIFLVSNIGGSLTPLGDPPLFLGFLRGVDFFWTTKHLLPRRLLFVGASCCSRVLRSIDYVIYREGGRARSRDPTPDTRARASSASSTSALLGVIIARHPDERVGRSRHGFTSARHRHRDRRTCCAISS